jgi:hypothetical protein
VSGRILILVLVIFALIAVVANVDRSRRINKENTQATRACQGWGFQKAERREDDSYDCVTSGIDDENHPHDYVVYFSRAADFELEARNLRIHTQEILGE